MRHRNHKWGIKMTMRTVYGGCWGIVLGSWTNFSGKHDLFRKSQKRLFFLKRGGGQSQNQNRGTRITLPSANSKRVAKKKSEQESRHKPIWVPRSHTECGSKKKKSCVERRGRTRAQHAGTNEKGEKANRAVNRKMGPCYRVPAEEGINMQGRARARELTLLDRKRLRQKSFGTGCVYQRGGQPGGKTIC